MFSMRFWLAFVLIILSGILAACLNIVEGKPHRILLDTDVDTDDMYSLLYLLKLNTSEFHLEVNHCLFCFSFRIINICIFFNFVIGANFEQGVTLNANAWTNAGHSVNQVYDILYMMGRDDIAVGVGGEGGILPNGTILPDVGGYLPIIEQVCLDYAECKNVFQMSAYFCVHD